MNGEKIRATDYIMRTETPLAKSGRRNGIWFIVEHKLKKTRAGYEARINGKTGTFYNLGDAVDFYNNGGVIR